MNVLESLSKKDKEWRKIAYNITGSKSEADDLVHDMYMRMYKYNRSKWNYSFVILVMWNLFKDKKKCKYTNAVEFSEKIYSKQVTKLEKNSFNDRELYLLSEIEKLTDYEKKLLELNYDLSVRDVAKGLQQCHVKTYRHLMDVRKKVLTDGFDEEYKNRRLKYKNVR